MEFVLDVFIHLIFVSLFFIVLTTPWKCKNFKSYIRNLLKED